MNDPKLMELSLARIYSADGSTVVGGGFLVTSRELVTCAHVIEQALPNPYGSVSNPTVWIDFPLVRPAVRKIRAQVLVMGDQACGMDIARLRLESNAPPNVTPTPLCLAHDMFNHACRTFGFPGELTDGVWAQGILKGPDAQGWIQFDGAGHHGMFVDEGFSGAPVWNDQLNAVVGMVSAKLLNSYHIKTAFMIPTSILLAAWGEYPMVWAPQQAAAQSMWLAYDAMKGCYRWATFNQFGQAVWV